MKKENNYGELISHKNTLLGIATLSMIMLTLVSNFLLNNTLDMVSAFARSDFSNMGEVEIRSVFNFRISEYPIFYAFTSIISMVMSVKIAYKLKSNYGSIVNGQKGTSEFTTLKELRAQYRAVPESKESFEGKGGVPISRENPTKLERFRSLILTDKMPYAGSKIYIDDSPVNNLIIGMTRSGKGETFVFPTIDIYSRAKEKSSMIINDPKGELVSASYDTLKERGYDIQVLNLVEPMRSMSYNPLQIIIDAYKSEEYSKAQSLCNTLTFSLYDDPSAKDKFWQLSAQSLVNAIILAIVHDKLETKEEEKITLYTVANFLSELGGRYYKEGDVEKNELDEFFQIRNANDIAKMQYATSNFAKGNTRGSIFATAMSKLQIFTFEEIGKMTSKSSYNLEDVGFGEKPVAIFMTTPDYDASNHVIASIFVRQLYYILARTSSLSDGQKCKREVVFLLDEFGNMPPIEGMANIITVCLGRNIRFNMIIQAYSQLKKLYGEDDKTIIGNCGNQIYILTNDLSTAEQFSKLVGNKTISTKSRSGKSFSMDKSKNESVDKRELLTPNELFSLKEGESVVVRVMKRQDKNRSRIKAKPIFNTDKTTLKFRYEYLADDFDTDKSIKNIEIECQHNDVDLKDLTFLGNIQKIAEKEEREEQEKKEVNIKKTSKVKLDSSEEIQLQEIFERTGIDFFAELDVKGMTPETVSKLIEDRRVLLGKHFFEIKRWLDNLEKNRE